MEGIRELIICFLFVFFLCFLLCVLLIPLLKRIKAGQYILKYVTEHEKKAGTPTMGGLAIITSLIIGCLVFSWSNQTLFYISVVFAFMFVGFLDDFLKIKSKNNLGLKPYQKIIFQIVLSIIVSVYFYINNKTNIILPISGKTVNIHLFIIPLVVFALIAMSNCVNLTDGLDGLVSNTSCAYFIDYLLLSLVQGEKYQQTIFSVCGLAACVAYLVFNTNKASVFMGDTGSLALGAYAFLTGACDGNILHIPIFGIMFVISGISVIVQVIYYKRTAKRVFLMTPIHHHYQMKGYSETKISYCYFCITLITGLIFVLAL